MSDDMLCSPSAILRGTEPVSALTRVLLYCTEPLSALTRVLLY